MTAKPAPPHPAAGFTLVEILVALAIAGLVSLIAMQGIGFATSGVTRLSATVERLDQHRGLEMQLRHAFGSMAAIPIWQGQPGFIGHSDSVAFLSVVDQGGAGLYRLKFAFEPARSGRPVILTRQQADSTGPPFRGEGVLARNIRAFSISYFGALNPGDKPAWQPRWEGLARPPSLVRVILDDGSRDAFPPIVIGLPNGG
jgi:general secretion pathway protein J